MLMQREICQLIIVARVIWCIISSLPRHGSMVSVSTPLQAVLGRGVQAIAELLRAGQREMGGTGCRRAKIQRGLCVCRGLAGQVEGGQRGIVRTQVG